ncbi:hypothetical protein VSDG_02411 [Cytospora chrysosperma]|uniref:Uncharacterized protein n=1 Tax=Cytospora chrysosperma TaxID=252740 RepID=A0A423WG28_CYTCH|nr:hypothetical protein VSDG_02411 [Valsa sordida]
MGDKGFQVPDEDAPPYDYKPAIQDPPHINKTPGSGDNLHIGVFKNSINRLSKTTVALIAGVIAVLIVAGTVVLTLYHEYSRQWRSHKPFRHISFFSIHAYIRLVIQFKHQQFHQFYFDQHRHAPMHKRRPLWWY